ncbi:MAG: 2'-5' RNA ligase family protein [Chloroflexi bacterium]|nr:2'-5' RNA ligase family protein [Chloroflexota bacterium]
MIDRLDTLSGTLKAFDLELGGIQTFGERVIYLGVKPTDSLLAARRPSSTPLARTSIAASNPISPWQCAWNNLLLTRRWLNCEKMNGKTAVSHLPSANFISCSGARMIPPGAPFTR